MAKLGHTMKKKIGIWIDHKEAILVSIEGGQTRVERIESHAESHFRPSGGWNKCDRGTKASLLLGEVGCCHPDICASGL
jgi:hypothetical protein